MSKTFHLSYDSPVGKLLISATDEGIVGISYDETRANDEHVHLHKAKEQLDAYFAGKQMVFDLPLVTKGTAFQEKVWQALANIPYGETRTYGDIAMSVDNPQGSRAVGGANNKNKLTIVIPCHRVVASNGLGGYAPGLWQKEWLLDHERKVKESSCSE